jgi:TolA-binding protein
MKAQERHHLKQNEFAVTTKRVAEAVMENRDRWLLIVGAVVVIGAVLGGYLFMRGRAADQASAAFGAALLTETAQIVPAPTVPGAKQQAGTFPTETARNEAALAAYKKVVDEYPNDETGRSARYQMAGLYLRTGRAADAERLYAEAANNAGTSLYGPMAQLGRAQALAALGKFDDALKILTDLSGQRDGALPVDGVLMELARVSERAGKTQEARAAYKRVVDEFAQSGYAGEARQRLAAIGA